MNFVGKICIGIKLTARVQLLFFIKFKQFLGKIPILSFFRFSELNVEMHNCVRMLKLFWNCCMQRTVDLRLFKHANSILDCSGNLVCIRVLTNLSVWVKFCISLFTPLAGQLAACHDYFRLGFAVTAHHVGST